MPCSQLVSCDANASTKRVLVWVLLADGEVEGRLIKKSEAEGGQDWDEGTRDEQEEWVWRMNKGIDGQWPQPRRVRGRGSEKAAGGRGRWQG